MKKQVVSTIIWVIVAFILFATFKYFLGVDDWLMETLKWIVPSAIGYFVGYGLARKEKR